MMKRMLLVLSAIFLVGVCGFPRMYLLSDVPVGAVLFIPQSETVVPWERTLPRSDGAPANFRLHTKDNDAVDEEPWNEYPEEQQSVSPIAFSIGRSKRSTQPGAPAPGGGQQQGQQSGDRGHVDIGVSRGEGGSRRVDARGEGNVWQSNDGRGRVDVHGHYSRDYGGRYGTGRPQYGGGIRYSHRF